MPAVTAMASMPQNVTRAVARAMVTQYGMTERLGAIKLGDDNSEPFLGRDMGHTRNYSEDVAAIVDSLEGAGYAGWYVLEQDTILAGDPADPATPAGAADPVADVRASVDHLATLGRRG